MLSHPSPQGVRGILAALSLSMLLSSLGISIANVGLPALATAFHASFRAVQWVLLCYLLAVTTCIIGIGRLGDSLNRRRLLLAGIALFTAASLACALAPQLWLLLAARPRRGWGRGHDVDRHGAGGRGTGHGKNRPRDGAARHDVGSGHRAGAVVGRRADRRLRLAGDVSDQSAAGPVGAVARPAILAGWGTPGSAPEPFDRAGTLLLGGALLCYSLAMTLGRGNFGALNPR